MGINLKQLFPKSTPQPKPVVIKAVKAAKRELSEMPVWLVGSGRTGVIGYIAPKKKLAVPPEFRAAYAYDQAPPHNFAVEKRLSSRVEMLPLFASPQGDSGLEAFQLLCKIKERLDVKAVWEYLMLDLWSQVLKRHCQGSALALSAPRPFQLDNERLYMELMSGTISDYLHHDFADNRVVDLNGAATEPITLYRAFALHLGALVRVKETEELMHGDFQLRHLLFDPGGLLKKLFYLRQAQSHFTRRPILVNIYLTAPGLSVVDVECSLRASISEVRVENDKLLTEARGYLAGRGLRKKMVEQAFRDGYDQMLHCNSVIQQCVIWQERRWGFSVDRLV